MVSQARGASQCVGLFVLAGIPGTHSLASVVLVSGGESPLIYSCENTGSDSQTHLKKMLNSRLDAPEHGLCTEHQECQSEKMNPYGPPSTPAPAASISLVALGVLTFGNLGLTSIAAVLCGISCYREIGGDNHDLMAVLLMFGVPSLAFAAIGIPAGLIHLRRGSKLDRIPLAAYIVALVGLVAASLWGNPIARWSSIFLVCCLISVVVSIRTAVRCQHPAGEPASSGGRMSRNLRRTV